MGAKDQPHEKHAAPSTESHLLSLHVHVRAFMHACAHMCGLYVCAYTCVLVCAHVFSCTCMLAYCTMFVLTRICSCTCVIIHVGDGKQALDVAC